MTGTATYRSEFRLRQKIARACWTLAWGLFCRLSPRPLHGWRRLWLRLFGAHIDSTAVVYPSARIWAPWNLTMGPRAAIGDEVDCYDVAPITLDEGAIASQRAFLCTASHDITDPGRRLVTAPIHLSRLSWVCAGAYVNLGVTIGEGAVVAACAVVVKDVAPWTVVGGNPAKFLKPRVFQSAAPQLAGNQI
jgi:putative colanic acid biosynthesis acetyltransferase WcaF